MIIEIFLFIGLVAILLYQSTKKPKDMPPGSYGIPIFGNLPSPNVHISEYFLNMKKKYGKIYTTKWGSRPVIVLADSQIIRKALNHPELQGRPDIFSFRNFNLSENLGIVQSFGKIWIDNRRFLLRHLKDLGMGKTHLEDSIQEEATMLVDYIENNLVGCGPVELDTSINVSVLNVIWQMLASKRYKADDEIVRLYTEMTTENFNVLQGKFLIFVDMMPWVESLLPKSLILKVTGFEKLVKNQESLHSFCETIVKEHQDTLDPNNPRDIIDQYLLEVEAEKDNPDSSFKLENSNLFAIMSDMFAAGSETTSSTLRWIILHLADDQELQSKVHEAIDAVVPRDRMPSLEDRQKLAFLDAVILDVMRLSSFVPTSVPHSTSNTVVFEGYTIPKNAIIFPCLELCHKDPELWEKPDKLYPQHFLDDDGKLDSKKEGFMPFSLGRRQCLGESLARMEVFIFAAAILQRFKVTPPPGVKLDLTTDPSKKILNMSKPFKVILQKRF